MKDDGEGARGRKNKWKVGRHHEKSKHFVANVVVRLCCCTLSKVGVWEDGAEEDN